MAYCKECGREVPEGVYFCDTCAIDHEPKEKPKDKTPTTRAGCLTLPILTGLALLAVLALLA